MPWDVFPGGTRRYTRWWYKKYGWTTIFRDPHNPYYSRQYNRLSKMPFQKVKRGARFGPQPKKYRRRFVNRGFKPRRKGFVKRYKRKAFVGKSLFNPRTIVKMIEPKKFFVTDINPITLTHTAGSDHQYVFAPMQDMIQGSERNDFVGESIWVRGISYRAFFGPVNTDSDSYWIRFCVFRTPSRTDFSTSAWTETSDADTNSEHAFFDCDYATVTERLLLQSSYNRNGACQLLYDKRILIGNSNTTAGANQRQFKLWLPLNQVHRFAGDLDTAFNTAPNFGRHGDIVFVLTWDNGSHISGGTKKSLVISGQQAITYFRDG